MPPLIDPSSVDPLGSYTRKRFILFIECTSRRCRRRHLLECSTGGAATGLAMFILASLQSPFNQFSGNKLIALLSVAGFCIGLLAGIVTVPSSQAVLARIDAVLGNDQLLSSAWWSHGENDRWQQSILALATRRCAGIQPRQLVPRKINSSGWSFILVVAVAAVSVRAIDATRATPAPFRPTTSLDDPWRNWATASAKSATVTAKLTVTSSNSAIEAKAENPETAVASNRDSNNSRLVSNDSADQTADRSSDAVGPGASNDLQGSPPALNWAGESAAKAKTKIASDHPAEMTALSANSGSGIRARSASSGDDQLATGTAYGSDSTSEHAVPWGDVAIHSPSPIGPSNREINDGIPAAYRKLASIYFLNTTGATEP